MDYWSNFEGDQPHHDVYSGAIKILETDEADPIAHLRYLLKKGSRGFLNKLNWKY